MLQLRYCTIARFVRSFVVTQVSEAGESADSGRMVVWMEFFLDGERRYKDSVACC